MSDIFLAKKDKNGDRLPVNFRVYKYGGGIYLTLENHDTGLNVGLVASAADMIAKLRRLAATIEVAVQVNEQGPISHAPVASHAGAGDASAPLGLRLNPGAMDWSWLTPEMVIKYFEQSPILAPVAADVRAVLKNQLGLTLPAAQHPTPTPQPTQLDLDLEAIQPHLGQIVQNGKINKSEIARILKITPGGSGNWARLVAIADALKKAA